MERVKDAKGAKGVELLGKRGGTVLSAANDTVGKKGGVPSTAPNSSLELAIYVIDGVDSLRHAWHQLLIFGTMRARFPHARSRASGFARPVAAVRAVCPGRSRPRSEPPDPADALD